MLEVVKNEYETMLERKLSMKITQTKHILLDSNCFQFECKLLIMYIIRSFD